MEYSKRRCGLLVSCILLFLPTVLCSLGEVSPEHYTYNEYEDYPIRLLNEREKRYVQDPIPRLASGYEGKGSVEGKGIRKVYPQLGFGIRSGRAETMLGDLPVNLHVAGHDAVSQSTTTDKPTTPSPMNVTSVKEVEHDITSDMNKTVDEILTSFDKNNLSLPEHNVSKPIQDQHKYYNSTIIINSTMAKSLWVDMMNKNHVIVNDLLSTTYRKAVTVKLSFEFPFYGHILKNITIATGGFLYTGDFIHTWLAATQYIAPLMGNFDPGLSNHSFVKYYDNGTAFTVEWDHVALQDNPDAGNYTFQATLLSTGDIVFVYKEIPFPVEEITDTIHPVKVGVSDAYVLDGSPLLYFRKKTIYEYHKINFKKEHIQNWSAVYMNALPNCIDQKDCESCLSANTHFDCKWCPGLNRCSMGYDRKRHEWLSSRCEKTFFTQEAECRSNLVPYSRKDTSIHQESPRVASVITKTRVHDAEEAGMSHSGLVGLLFVVAFISGGGLWVYYAYRNPHTPSGQVLIKYRPSQWSLRRGEARYTAASIHM